MIRETSIEAYTQIKNEGLLSKLRFIVYECIFIHGPITQGECWDIIKQFRKMNSSGCITSRFAELKNLGVISEVQTRPCRITQRNCIEWSITNNLPHKYERKSKDQIIKELRKEIEDLKKLTSTRFGKVEIPMRFGKMEIVGQLNLL